MIRQGISIYWALEPSVWNRFLSHYIDERVYCGSYSITVSISARLSTSVSRMLLALIEAEVADAHVPVVNLAVHSV